MCGDGGDWVVITCLPLCNVTEIRHGSLLWEDLWGRPNPAGLLDKRQEHRSVSQVLAQKLNCHVILGNSLYCLGPRFPHLLNGGEKDELGDFLGTFPTLLHVIWGWAKAVSLFVGLLFPGGEGCLCLSLKKWVLSYEAHHSFIHLASEVLVYLLPALFQGLQRGWWAGQISCIMELTLQWQDFSKKYRRVTIYNGSSHDL